MRRVHLNSNGAASCGQRDGLVDVANGVAVSCKFCIGIMKLRISRLFRDCARIMWLPYQLHGKAVWAQCDMKGHLLYEADNLVTIVYAMPPTGKRYRAYYGNVVPR